MTAAAESQSLIPIAAFLKLQEGAPGTVESRTRLLIGIAEELVALHAEGLLHRRLTLEHIRCTADARVVNLGPLSEEIGLGEGAENTSDSAPPEVHGSLPVRLPALISKADAALRGAGCEINAVQIDLYQFAALACRLLTDEPLAAYLRSPRTKSKVPVALRPIIERALAVSSADAIRTSAELADELRAVVGEPAAARSAAASSAETDASKLSIAADTSLSGSSHARRPMGAGELPWDKLGHYQLVRRIGHGGMGDVYLGYEAALGRNVAIKVLPTDLARQSEFVRRFYAEASAAARVVHPNIIPIHYIGEDQGHHFFAMQYVEGETLAALLRRRRRLTVDEAIDLLDQVLSGLEAAHAQVLIHRDIKPGNILLDQSGTRALLADFGLAKSLRSDETGHTVTGVVMGTVDYMSPEQGRGHSVDHRSDLYSLGVLAYQMLSGRLPFTADSPTALIFQHVYERPKPLNTEVADVPAALSAVVAKLLAKSPDARHPSAAAVRADLRAARQGTPLPSGADSALVRDPEAFSRPSAAGPATVLIQAPTFPDDLAIDEAEPAGQSEGWRDKLELWLGIKTPQSADWLSNTQLQVDGAVAEYERRRDRLAGLAREAESALEELGTQEAAWRGPDVRPGDTAIRTVEELREAREAQEAQLETMRVRLAQVNARLEQLRAQRNVLNARLRAAQAQIPAGRRFIAQPVLRPWRVLALLSLLAILTLVVVRLIPPPLPAKLQQESSVGTTPRQSTLPASASYVSAPSQTPAAMAAAAIARGGIRDPYSGIEQHLAISSDGQVLATSLFDPNRESGKTSEIKLWDLTSLREIRSMNEPHRSFAMKLSSDTNALFSAGFSEDGSYTKEFKVWDTRTGTAERAIPTNFEHYNVGVGISADGSSGAGLLRDSSAQLGIFDLRTGAVVSVPKIDSLDTATSMATTADGKLAAISVFQVTSLGERAAIDIYDLQTHKMRTSLPVDALTRHLSFSGDGQWLMAVGREIYIWETGTWVLKHRFPYTYAAQAVTAMSHDGRYLASLQLGKVSVWSVETGAVTELAINEYALDLVFAQGAILVVALPKSVFTFFDASTGKQQLTPVSAPVSAMWPTSVDVEPLWTAQLDQHARAAIINGEAVTSVDGRGRIERRTLAGGDILELQSAGSELTNPILSSSGNWLAGAVSGTSEGAAGVHLWSVQTRAPVNLRDPESASTPVSFADNEHALVTSVERPDGQEIVFHDLATHAEIRRVTVPPGGSASIAVHSSGKLLAVSRPDQTVLVLRLSDATSDGNDNWIPMAGHGRVLGFHPRDNRLLVADDTGRLRIINVDSQAEVLECRTRDGPVIDAELDQSGRRCATVSSNGVCVWDLALGYVRLMLRIPSVTAVTFSSDGRRLAICDNSAHLFLYDTSFPALQIDAEAWQTKMASNSDIGELPAWSPYDPSHAKTPDGRFMIHAEGTLDLIVTQTGKRLHSFGGASQVQSVAVSPDGQFVASAGYDPNTQRGDVRLWNLGTGEELRRFDGHVHYGWSVAFSPDGKRMLTGGTGNLHLWDVETGNQIRLFPAGMSFVKRAVFSADGRWAVADATAEQRSVLTSVFDIESGAELIALHGGYPELVLNDSPRLRDTRFGEVRFGPQGE